MFVICIRIWVQCTTLIGLEINSLHKRSPDCICCFSPSAIYSIYTIHICIYCSQQSCRPLASVNRDFSVLKLLIKVRPEQGEGGGTMWYIMMNAEHASCDHEASGASVGGWRTHIVNAYSVPELFKLDRCLLR